MRSRPKPTIDESHDLHITLGGKGGKLKQWAFRSPQEEAQITEATRGVLRVLFIMFQEFFQTSISLRASALTFSVILSLVPMLAMSTAVLKGMGSGDQLRTIAYRFIEELEPEDTQSPLSSKITENEAVAQAEASTPSDNDTTTASLDSYLRNGVETIFNYVENTNFAALGAFGTAGLLIVVILVFSSVEDAMNAIWHTKKGRSLFRKTMDYLALLILLPISINVAIAGDAILESPTMMGYITTFIPWPWVINMVFKLLPFAFFTLTLLLMYLFFPHVKVKTVPALAGAIFGAIFWFIVQRAYLELQIGVSKYNAIYGSFATVPLVLVWIQLGWTFVLLGAVLAHAIQTRDQYRLVEAPSKARLELQCAFDLLLTVYNSFAGGAVTSMNKLQEAFPEIDDYVFNSTIDLLSKGGLLHRVKEDDTIGLVPARPPESLTAEEVVRLVLGEEQTGVSVGGTLADRIVQGAGTIIPAAEFPEKYLTEG